MPANVSKSGFFSFEKRSCIAALRFHECPFRYGTDLAAKTNLLNFMDNISKDRDIKVLILFNTPESKGCEYILNLCQKTDSSGTYKLEFERIQNAVNQYIMKIISFNKIVIHIDPRNSIPLFMNMSFACNYRIITDKAVFHTKNIEKGLLTKGGEIYFLKKLVGLKKTSEIFLLGKELSAKEALDIGLVNQIVPLADLEIAAFRVGNAIAKKPAYILSAIKKLLNSEISEIQSSLEYENLIGSLMIERQEFKEKVIGSTWNCD